MTTARPRTDDANTIVRVTAAFVVALGAVVLVVGWWGDVEGVRRVLPSLESMKANTALGFMLVGALVWLVGTDRQAPARVVGVVLTVLGLATVVEYAVDVSLGIDELLATDPGTTGVPGRMGLNSAIAFTGVGITGILSTFHGRARVVGQGVAVVTGVVGTFAFLGYVYGVATARGVIESATEMALHTAVGFIVAAVGLVAATSDVGLVSELRGGQRSGVVARRTLFASIAGVVASAVVAESLVAFGVVDRAELVLAITVTLSLLVVGGGVLIVARGLRESDERVTELLEDQNRELERRVEERTAELEAANRELERFAYVASHDLQEPLRMVTAFVTKIDDQYGEVFDAKGRQYLDFAVDGAQRMSELITALLDFSRVGTGPLTELVAVPLEELVEDVVATMRTSLDEADATIRVAPGLPTVRCEPVLLRQVLQNLLSNAVKFAAPERAPVVVVDARESTWCWEVSVEDNGIGIDPKFAESVFQMFRRLHGRGHYPGTGIGLAIAQRIVERHGGTIRCEPADPGARFVFTVPR